MQGLPLSIIKTFLKDLPKAIPADKRVLVEERYKDIMRTIGTLEVKVKQEVEGAVAVQAVVSRLAHWSSSAYSW